MGEGKKSSGSGFTGSITERCDTNTINSAMNQSQFLAITCNSLEAREKSRVHGAIGFGFGFASHWLKNWRESFKPITTRSNRNQLITFDSHLKTSLLWFCVVICRILILCLWTPEYGLSVCWCGDLQQRLRSYPWF